MGSDRPAESNDRTRNEERWLLALNDVLRAVVRYPSLLEGDALQQLATTLGRHLPIEQLTVVLSEEGTRSIHSVLFDRTAAVARSSGVCIVPELRHQPVALPDEPRLSIDPGTNELPIELAGGVDFRPYWTLPIPGTGLEPAHLVLFFCERAAAIQTPLEFLRALAGLIGTNLRHALDPTRDRRLAKILDTSDDAMLAWTAEGLVIEANEAASLLTEIPRARLVGSTLIQDLLEPLSRPLDRAGSLRPARLELVAGRGTGSERRVPVSVTMTPVKNDPLVVAHALVRDESQMVAAEREAASHLARIRLLEKELRTLLDNAPLIIFRLDPNTGQLLYLNRHAERLLRVPTDEALRTPGFLRAAHADGEALRAFDEAFHDARRGVRSPPYEARLLGNMDAEIAVRGTIYPLLSDEGGVVAIEGILADVSAEHAARSRLVQADRLSTLGMLAASVAHEINNPAAFLVLGLEQLERFLSASSLPDVDRTIARPKLDARALVSDLRESIDRIVRIARDLRLFAGSTGESSRLARVDVRDAVQSALTLARAQLIEHARVILDLEPVPPVLMEDGRLGQVLVNLLVNAAQAVARQPGYGHLVNVTTRASSGAVEIAVSDTGVGVRPEDLERIWLPFFTTKSTEYGTGLGLSISREIIEKAGGSIRVESPTVVTQDQPHGSRFVISLPPADPDQPRAPAPIAESKQPRRRRRILVVDDERALASALASALGRVHDVAIAGDGRKALELMAEERFDAVLCDLCMPDISGETVYRHERERNRSHAGVFIFMTGIGFGGDAEGFLASTGRPYLEKPFSLERALDAIERVAPS